MSKTKTKRARRELKREANRKIAAHQRKTTTAAAKPTKPSTPSSKKQKSNHDASITPTPTTIPHTQASQKHPIPFGTYDNILLVGEGDFSFAHSLVSHHACANVTATSFDTSADVREKYPSFAAIHDELVALTPPVPIHHGIDATKLGTYKALRGERGEGWEGWDTVAFMFPHTGGLSTDVNRQVRANQALLVGFFKSCVSEHKGRAFLKTGGKVLVCLFEGEPYTLWNVKDLGRHVGLRVVESYAFAWEEYPGYAHVRTLGRLREVGRGEERRGGREWEGKGQQEKSKGRKRPRDESESESDEG
ncbi:hypothetical protein N0V90_001543 [Kalmusia sp. IMI 367209]|nr:hypothetical protein N0V90_001543 [Kalmusia sp. IMI 367209]